MDNSNCNTEHKKYQRIKSEERHEIEVRLKDGWSIYAIAKHLGRPYNTIRNEVERGTVYLYNGKVARYKADKGKEVYLERRKTAAEKSIVLKWSIFFNMLKRNSVKKAGRLMLV